MYVTYTIFWYEMSFLRYIRLLTCQHRWVNLVFTLMSTPVTRKKHTTKQNISLVRQEDIKMYVTCTIWMYVCMLPTCQFQKTYLPTHQFQGQNIGQKVITPKFTQTTKMMSDLNFWLFPLFKDTFSRLDHWFKRYGVLKLGAPLFSLNFYKINPHISETNHPINEKF